MRPLEILLWLVECFTFLAFISPRVGMRWMGYAALAGVLLAGAQLVEGPRWQLVPAYTLSVLFLLVWLLQGRRPDQDGAASPYSHRLLSGLCAGVGAIALMLAAALPAILPVFRFPRPNGPHAIGTLTYHWVDDARPEIFTAAHDDRRGLMVQVWYPAQRGQRSAYAPYVEGGDFSALAALLHLPTYFFDHLTYVTTNARPAALVAGGGAKFPVLIFSPGRGGFRQHNTFQVEELVSRGFVVAAIDHPFAGSGMTFPDGRRVVLDPRMIEDDFVRSVTAYLGQDAVFALDQLAKLNKADPTNILTGRLDLQRAGIFGVSLGGMVVAEACRLDYRFRACLIMDAPVPQSVVRSGLPQPTMWISRDADTMRLEGWSPAAIDEHQTGMRTVFAGLPDAGYLVLVPGMFHANLSDFPLLIYPPLASALGVIGPIGWRRAHTIVNAYSLAFFERHLNGLSENLLNGPSEQYSDVNFEARLLAR